MFVLSLIVQLKRNTSTFKQMTHSVSAQLLLKLRPCCYGCRCWWTCSIRLRRTSVCFLWWTRSRRRRRSRCTTTWWKRSWRRYDSICEISTSSSRCSASPSPPTPCCSPLTWVATLHPRAPPPPAAGFTRVSLPAGRGEHLQSYRGHPRGDGEAAGVNRRYGGDDRRD